MEAALSPSDSRADQFLLSTFILLAISWIVYLCRLYTRLWLVRSMFMENLFITVAMVALTAFAAMVPVQTMHGGGQHLVNVADPTHNIPQWGRAFFVAEVMYLVTLWGVKLSVAFLLLRFSTSKLLSWTLRSVAAIVTGVTIAFVLWVTFQCHPVESQWDSSVTGVCASRQTYVVSVYILSSISAVTDLVMAVAPIFILRTLNIDKRTKWYAAITMSLGSLACVATVIRFKFIRDFSISEDVTYEMVPLSICSFIEVSLGCICASLATLRPFLQKLFIEKHTSQLNERNDGSRFVTNCSYESTQLQKGWELVNNENTSHCTGRIVAKI